MLLKKTKIAIAGVGTVGSGVIESDETMSTPITQNSSFVKIL